MLALVEKYDEDFKTYRISVKELSNILGSKNKNLYREFDKAINEFRYKDALEIGTELKIKSESDAGITLDYYDNINQQKTNWNSSHDLMHFEDQNDFITAITLNFHSGWRADE